jgi:hypothetical protein
VTSLSSDRPLTVDRVLLVALPVILISLLFFLFRDAKGPYWLGTNLDPDYAIYSMP